MMRKLLLGLVLSATLLAVWAAPAAPPQPTARLSWGLEAAGALEAGTPIELRLEVWVSTWFQAPVDFPATLAGEGALVEQIAGSPDSRFEELNGRRWTGLIRRYRVLPLQSGTVSVALPAPLRVQAGGADGRSLTLRPPEPLRLTVRLPAGAEDIQPFVAARRLELRQRWQPDANPATPWQVGDLVQRDIELHTDSSSPWLPEPDFGQPAGTQVRVSAPSQQEQRAHSAATPTLTRQHRASYHLTQAGVVALPAVEFVWWDLQQRRRRVTRLEGVTLTVQAAADRSDPFAEPVPPGETRASTAGPFPLLAWVTVVGTVVGLVWLLRRRRWRLTAPWMQTLSVRYGGYLDWQKLRQACRGHDAEAAARALTLVQARLTMQELTRWRRDALFHKASSDLSRWRFGLAPLAAGERWNGDALLAAVRGLRRGARPQRLRGALPDLNP